SATKHRGTSPRVQAGSPPEGRAANAPAASPAVRPQPPFRSELPRLDPELRKRPIPEQQRYLLDLLYAQEGPPPEARADLDTTITGSAWLGFGNPKVAEPMLSQEACWALWRDRTPAPPDPGCGHPNMVRVTGSNACIDQYEFPNVLCEYPVVWVRSSEAKLLCEALGKRLCDAHEWEGACAGQVRPPGEDYAYARLPKGQGADYRRARRLLMEDWHNKERQLVWAYGSTKNH